MWSKGLPVRKNNYLYFCKQAQEKSIFSTHNNWASIHSNPIRDNRVFVLQFICNVSHRGKPTSSFFLLLFFQFTPSSSLLLLPEELTGADSCHSNANVISWTHTTFNAQIILQCRFGGWGFYSDFVNAWTLHECWVGEGTAALTCILDTCSSCRQGCAYVC